MHAQGRTTIGEATTDRVVLHSMPVHEDMMSTEAKFAIGLGVAVVAAIYLEHEIGLLTRTANLVFPKVLEVQRYYLRSS